MAVHIDSAGLVWYLDQETGQPKPYASYAVWDGASCTGNEYIYYPPAPRVVLQLATESSLRVRNDTDRATTVPLKSINMGSGCAPFVTTAPAIALSSTDVVPGGAPAVPYSGPLHLEAE